MGLTTTTIFKWLAGCVLLMALAMPRRTEGRLIMNYQNRASCPHAEFIQPCSCRMTVYGMHVVCLRVNSFNDLQRIFTILRDYELGTLLLQETRLPSYQECHRLFSGLRVLILRLVACTLPDNSRLVDADDNSGYVLDGLGTALKRIDITNCNVGTNGVVHLGLGRLPLLTEINVHQERLGTVKKNWFDGMTTSTDRSDGSVPSDAFSAKIQVVRLEDNAIARLDDRAFQGLTDLVVLSLAKNSLNDVRRSVLPETARFLTTIDLSHNALTTLPQNFFTKMPVLQKVLLYNNKMSTLDHGTFAPVFGNLDTLWVYDNPLVCDSNLNWMISSRKPRNLEGVCDSPDAQRGTHLNDMVAYTSGALAEALQEDQRQ